ncbi:hypothetical protein JCM11641_003757 [Rhodosporidiobolus odoratus]
MNPTRPSSGLQLLLRDFAQAVRSPPPHRHLASLISFTLIDQAAQRRPSPPLRTFSSTHPAVPSPAAPQRLGGLTFPSSSSSTSSRFSRSSPVFRSTFRRYFGSSTEITTLRAAATAARGTPDEPAAKLRLLALLAQDTSLEAKQEVVALYEEATALWPSEAQAQSSAGAAQAAKDEPAFQAYLKALAGVAGQAADGPESAKLFEKLQLAKGRREELVKLAPAAAPPETSTAPPETSTPSPSSAPAPSLTPASLITGIFSGLRGKGGQAKVQSVGTHASFSGKTAEGGSEPIRVIVEEAKSPLVWRVLKFVLTTALYSFLLLSLLSLLIDSSGILRAGGQSTPFAAVPPPDPTDPGKRGTTFKDVHGCEEAKHELYEIVEFLKDPERFEKLGGRLPRGVLLTGPPGTGKTLLARAIAGEAGVPFFSASGSEFDEMYVGVGARRIRELFTAARKSSPAIVFIDELDAIGGKRSPKDQTFHKQTLNQLLTELDGFATGEGIILIGATNFPESLDKALVRPGRFDRHVVVPLPDVRGRMEILKHHMRNIRYDQDAVDTSIIARGTIGFSGADIQALVNQAAVKASAENASSVRGSHFEWAKERIMMGAARKSAYITPENKLATAYHEAGHALLAMYTKGAYPLQSITVIPRGNALGYTLMLPEMDKQSHSFVEYRAKLDVAMGGRVAEELIYGKDNISDGASSDISNATSIANSMVRRLGFSDAVGPVSFGDSDGPGPSGETQKLIDAEIKGLIEAAQERARVTLRNKKGELERLAKALVEYETLDAAEVQKVIKGEKLERTGLE